MRHLTTEQAEASHMRLGQPRSVDEVDGEFRNTNLGDILLEMLRIAVAIDQAAARREADAIIGMRRSSYRKTGAEILAAIILDKLGDDRDCYPIREAVEVVVRRQAEGME